MSEPLQVPVVFDPTHEPEDPPGFPAIDIQAAPGTPVLAPENGAILRVEPGEHVLMIRLVAHAHPEEGVPHSIYLLDNFETVAVIPGEYVQAGQMLGTVAASFEGDDHLHVGKLYVDEPV